MDCNNTLYHCLNPSLLPIQEEILVVVAAAADVVAVADGVILDFLVAAVLQKSSLSWGVPISSL